MYLSLPCFLPFRHCQMNDIIEKIREKERELKREKERERELAFCYDDKPYKLNTAAMCNITGR